MIKFTFLVTLTSTYIKMTLTFSPKNILNNDLVPRDVKNYHEFCNFWSKTINNSPNKGNIFQLHNY